MRSCPFFGRSSFRQAAHPFTAGIASQLRWAWVWWCQYALDVGAIDEAERGVLEVRAPMALAHALGAQGGTQHESDPVDQFLNS